MIKTGTAHGIALGYFEGLRQLRDSAGATKERSSYPVLANLLDAVGAMLTPKVHCVSEPADRGTGHPDFGLFSTQPSGVPGPGTKWVPDRGVVEVKPIDDDAWVTASGVQVTRHRSHHRLVLVTNLRTFVLVGENSAGQRVRMDTLVLADSPAEFDRLLDNPAALARDAGPGLVEHLVRALSHRATIADPRDLARVLASYARESLDLVEKAGESPSLSQVREALEDSLGIRFAGDKGTHFFRSTFVQTLFYGIFSAWVLWVRSRPMDDTPLFAEGHPGPGGFIWRREVRKLRVPVLSALFSRLSEPAHTLPGIEDRLERASETLNRVDRREFFGRLKEGEAVQYFYEPFLMEFDPRLRKSLGVWYTPQEVVRYMVTRVDRALRDGLGIKEGLAAENVYVLDPCCGTGAYLAEVLRRIAKRGSPRLRGALAGEHIRQAATRRLFGFEIMPAPLVVAHLQIELTLEELGASLGENGTTQPQVFLTNALTGWQKGQETHPLPIGELEKERERARQVKQDTPILVILGNPPYSSDTEAAEDEELRLTDAYRATTRVRRPQGRGLVDLYVRFFRMAERRITETTGKGIVCLISNHSWLDGLSHTGMRERYLDVFDLVRIDCLNGDKYATGKLTPDGEPDPSIFSTESNPEGIQVGTAIATLVRKERHRPTETIEFRHLWGTRKRETLLETSEDPDTLYETIKPELSLGLPFVAAKTSKGWAIWPSVTELFPCRVPGVHTGRDRLLVDLDRARLKRRMSDYFDRKIPDDVIAKQYPEAMMELAHFKPRAVRARLLERGGPLREGFVRYAYRPFDVRWVYWDSDPGLYNNPGTSQQQHVFPGNKWLVIQQKPRREWSPAQVTSCLGCLDLMDRGASFFPMWLNGDGIPAEKQDGSKRRPNLSRHAERYLRRLGAGDDDLWHFVLACLHDPKYQRENAGALRMGWPRIPLPGWPKGTGRRAAEKFALMAERGRTLARLLDMEENLPDVSGNVGVDLSSVAVPTTVGGSNMFGKDFELSSRWGNLGSGNSVMPGPGLVTERRCAPDESASLKGAKTALGKTTTDIGMNERAYWRNVPRDVWDYEIGGYQVLKKWLSYRAHPVLGRAMRGKEVSDFTEIAKRISLVLLVTKGKVT